MKIFLCDEGTNNKFLNNSAGKTTALYRLKFDQYLNTGIIFTFFKINFYINILTSGLTLVPTIGFNCEKIRGTVGKSKGVQFLVWGKI